MLAYAAALGGRGELMRAGMVEQQKGAQPRAVLAVVKQRADRESIADPMLLRGTVNSLNGLLHLLLLVGARARAGLRTCWKQL